MQNLLMLGWLIVTVFLICKLTNDKAKIYLFLLIYFGVTVINDIFFMSTIELANAFGISYQLSDMLSLVTLGVIVIDVVKKPCIKKNIFNYLLVLIVILLFVSVIAGVIDYGFSAEWMGDLRTNSAFFFTFFYFVRFDVLGAIVKYRKWLDVTMTIILVLSYILWILDIGLGFHPLSSQYNATLSDGGSTMRFVQPYQVLGIAIYALILIKEDLNERGYLKIRTILFVSAVILFQHRSIWFAFGIGTVVVSIGSLKRKEIQRRFLAQIMLFLFLGVGVLSFGNGEIITNIENSFELLGKMLRGESIENTTANTRMQIWEAVIEELEGTAALIGHPHGFGYANSIGWKTSPHGGFIRFVARVGYIGGFLGLVLSLVLLIRLIRSRNYNFLAYLVCVFGFMYGYDYTWLCGMIIGVSISNVNNTKTYVEEQLKQRRKFDYEARNEINNNLFER